MRLEDTVSLTAARTGLAKVTCKHIIDGLLDTITDELSAGRGISLGKIGTFSTYYRKAYVGVNPQDLEKVEVKGQNRVKYKASQTLKDNIN